MWVLELSFPILRWQSSRCAHGKITLKNYKGNEKKEEETATKRKTFKQQEKSETRRTKRNYEKEIEWASSSQSCGDSWTPLEEGCKKLEWWG